jgi:outer membrane protein
MPVNILRMSVLAVACSMGTGLVFAQAASTPGAVANGKIGMIDARQAIVSTAEGKQASSELQSQFAPRQNELESLGKQVNDLKQRLAAGQTTLSDEEKNRLGQQGQRLTVQFDRKSNELNEDVQSAQAEVVERIGRKMVDVLDRYSRENGFIAVFDSSAQNSPILYRSNSIDLTQEIIRRYDQAYPSKSATPSNKPAVSPKPTTTPTAKPH